MSDAQQKSFIDSMLDGVNAEAEVEEMETLEGEPLGEGIEEGAEMPEEAEVEVEAEEEIDPQVEPEAEVEEDNSTLLLKELQDQVRQLREDNKELRQEIKAAKASPEDDGETKVGERPRGDKPPEFFTEEEWEEAQLRPKKFAEILGRVYSKAREDVMRDLPQVVQRTTQRTVSQSTAISNFWKENSDLKEFKGYVSNVANEVQAESPEMNLTDVLDETAKRVREKLKLDERAGNRETQRRKKAASSNARFAKKPGSRGGGPKADTRSDQQKQIDALINV